VSRLEWQTLSTLFEREGISQEDLHAVLAPFTDISTLSNILARFAEMKWLDISINDKGTIIYHLNNEGRERHRRVFQAQQEARELTMKGITAEDYLIVIRTLQQIATNLEMTESLTSDGS
jgi:DNA-binding MarR family transcriptional regulator